MSPRAIWQSAWMTRIRLSLQLLTERRMMLFLAVDAAFLLLALLMAFEGNGSQAFWMSLVLGPALVIGVPILSESVAVERRAGTLDVVLASPGAWFYFQRRIASFSLLLILHGECAVIFTRIAVGRFPLSGPMLQVVTITLLLAAAMFNWSLRTRSSGAAAFATYATTIGLAPWFYSNPVIPSDVRGSMTSVEIVTWLTANLILLAAAAVLYAYALQRLANPEAIVQ
jgi:hypothetical protein